MYDNMKVSQRKPRGGIQVNGNELKAEIIRSGMTVPTIADIIGIGKKAFYSKMKGETQFKQKEISDLKKKLNLSDEKVNMIFFNL